MANTLQRVSGITIEKKAVVKRDTRSSEEWKKIHQYLINGIKIPSPENKSRFVPLDIFPSELLERLEAANHHPSMEGDAIGGTINLVMKDAPAPKLLQSKSIGWLQ